MWQVEAVIRWPLQCRSTPELDQLQAQLAALMTSRTAADVLEHRCRLAAAATMHTIATRARASMPRAEPTEIALKALNVICGRYADTG